MLTLILLLDPSRLMTPRVAPSSPAWCAKVGELKKIDFGATVAPASPHFDDATMMVRELQTVTFDQP